MCIRDSVNINSAFLDKDGTFLPGITGDLVHLTEKGYRLWADALLPEIKKYMKTVRYPLPPGQRPSRPHLRRSGQPSMVVTPAHKKPEGDVYKRQGLFFPAGWS